MYRDARNRQKRRRIVCLEWDGRSLRVAEATVSRKGVRLEKVFSAPLASDVDVSDSTALGKFIRKVLDERGVSARLAVVDVPRNQAILTTLMLPTSAPQELPGMVEFQIAKELPFPLSEAVVDFAVPHETTEKTSPVLVAAVRNEIIEQFSAVVTAAGLRLESVGLRPFASKTAVTRMLGPNLPERVLFVDVGPTMTEIDVITSETVPFSRAADVQVPHDVAELRTLKLSEPSPLEDVLGAAPAPLSSLESVVESLVLEVTRSVEAYRARERGQRIAHAVIAGSMGVEEPLQETLQKRFDFTVELYNPAATFGWTPDEGASATGFASVLGLVLAHDADPAHHFDFLHPKKPVTQAEVQLRRAPRFVGWAAAIVLTGLAVYYSSIASDLKRKAAIQASIDEMLKDQDEKTQFIKLVEDLKAYDDKQSRWLDDFATMAMQLPDNKEFVLGEVRMDAGERKFLVEARFPEKGREGWQIPFEVEEKLEGFRREGATKPRFEVDLGPTTKNTVNPKYPLKQQFAVFVQDDGLPTPPAKITAKFTDQFVAPPRPGVRGAPSTNPPAGPATGKTAAPDKPASESESEVDRHDKDRGKRKDEGPDAGAGGAGEPGKPADSVTNPPAGNPRGGATPGSSVKPAARPALPTRPSSSGSTTTGKAPVSGTKTDAQGRPLPPPESSDARSGEGRSPAEGQDTSTKPGGKD